MRLPLLREVLRDILTLFGDLKNFRCTGNGTFWLPVRDFYKGNFQKSGSYGWVGGQKSPNYVITSATKLLRTWRSSQLRLRALGSQLRAV